MKKIKREAYADMYGPTTGDKIRLASHGNGVYEAALPDMRMTCPGRLK